LLSSEYLSSNSQPLPALQEYLEVLQEGEDGVI
jgi:hypothetical protein